MPGGCVSAVLLQYFGNRAVYDLLVATSIEKAATQGKRISIRSPLKMFTVKKWRLASSCSQQLLWQFYLHGCPLISAVNNKRFRCMLHKFAKAGVLAPGIALDLESVKMEVSALVRIFVNERM